MRYFYSVNSRRTLELKIKRSTFICTMDPVENLTQAKAFISDVSKAHKTATHNCWAYIVGETGDISHSSDAGEPAGTAGQPMLNAMQHYDITCTATVVTRYFGGVKLGIRGLIDAYSTCVKQCIEQKKLVKRVKTLCWQIEVPYGFNDTLVHHLQTFKGRIRHSAYTDKVTHLFEAEMVDSDAVETLLSEYAGAGQLSYSLKE